MPWSISNMLRWLGYGIKYTPRRANRLVEDVQQSFTLPFARCGNALIPNIADPSGATVVRHSDLMNAATFNFANMLPGDVNLPEVYDYFEIYVADPAPLVQVYEADGVTTRTMVPIAISAAYDSVNNAVVGCTSYKFYARTNKVWIGILGAGNPMVHMQAYRFNPVEQ